MSTKKDGILAIATIVTSYSPITNDKCFVVVLSFNSKDCFIKRVIEEVNPGSVNEAIELTAEWFHRGLDSHSIDVLHIYHDGNRLAEVFRKDYCEEFAFMVGYKNRFGDSDQITVVSKSGRILVELRCNQYMQNYPRRFESGQESTVQLAKIIIAVYQYWSSIKDEENAYLGDACNYKMWAKPHSVIAVGCWHRIHADRVADMLNTYPRFHKQMEILSKESI